jgi:two-component system phosphate regulon sensor histidine kinase PhoR
MEAGRRPYALVPVDLNEVVRGALESFAPHFTNAGFSPVVDLDPALPSVRADREAVEEALINLLDNAVKYSGQEKFLRVATGVRMDDVYVEVEDHGPGIPGAYRDRIFETFFRVPTTEGTGAKGSGLGLAIARHIMDAHGGRIDLAGAPGKGSTFTLVFKYEHDTRH